MNWHFLPVSRDRYEEARAEILRLQRRIEKLEDALDARAMAVLQSSLRKNGYMQIGERDEMVTMERPEPAPAWTSLDERMYAAWARDYMSQSGADEKEALEKWANSYGNSPPSRVLI